MPQNLPEQILQRIVRLSADGNSQREVARMLGVFQGCISTICNATERLADHTRGSVEVQWKPPRHGKTVNCSEWSERTASSRLLVCECKWSADLGGGCQFEPSGDGFWPPDIIGLGVQADALGSIWSTGDTAVSVCVCVCVCVCVWGGGGGGGAQRVGPQTMETLYLQWWVSFLLIPQWRFSPGAPQVRWGADWCLRPA